MIPTPPHPIDDVWLVSLKRNVWSVLRISTGLSTDECLPKSITPVYSCTWQQVLDSTPIKHETLPSFGVIVKFAWAFLILQHNLLDITVSWIFLLPTINATIIQYVLSHSFIHYLFIFSILFSEMKNIICPLFYLFFR